MDDCIFCKILSGDLPSHKIYEDDRALVILDIQPVNQGHALIILKDHQENMLANSDEDLAHAIALAKKLAPTIMKSVEANAFNFIVNTGRASGQTIFHTHLHIIPRFPTDGHASWTGNSDTHADVGSLAEKIRNTIAS